MKKIITICAALLMTASVFAQAPDKMSYQAVVRDGSNALVTSTAVGMQLSILQGSASGTAVYVETQTPTTNTNGLVSLEIGSGTVVSGTFSTIDWANGPYFIKTETDPTGGTSYTITGTSELLSVPYALHAKTAETVTGTITETDPVFGASVASGITATDTTYWNNKLDAEVDGSITNEIQVLSISNDTVYLSNGGFVKLPAGFDGQYSSLTGVPTNVSSFTNDAGYLIGYIETDPVFGSSVASSITATDTTYWNNKLDAEVDGSITNELQTISRTGTTVTLSNGGGTFQDSVGVYTAGTGIDITGNVVSTVSPCGLTIGQTYQGGIIFYLDASGCHGLISAPTDQSVGIKWDNGVNVDTYAYGNGIGSGEGNSQGIRRWQGDCASCYASELCQDLSLGGYSDWYLPSKYELNLMYHNIGKGNALGLGNVGGFTDNYYWSSTEFSDGDALAVLFTNGFQLFSIKTNPFFVRAIRAF